jgi:hypothetical protein
MRRLLFIGISTSLGTVVSAGTADLPVYTKALPRSPAAWSWADFYLGPQGGAGWAQDSLSAMQYCPLGVCGPIVRVTRFPDLFQSTYGLRGLRRGGSAGFNVDGRGDCTPLGSGVSSPAGCHPNWASVGTLTGRPGAPVDHAVVHVRAAGAWGQVNRDVLGAIFGPVPLTSSIGDNRPRYTIGAGIETRVANLL